MKTFIMIGWRNLWRNKRRSLVVIFSISLGIFAMLFSMSIMNGMNKQMVENAIRTSLGHISIHSKGFHEDMTLKNSFAPSLSLKKILSEIPEIQYAPRIKLEGMIRSSEASRGVMIMGINPELEKSVSNIYKYVLDKSAYLSDPYSKDILISKTLGQKLDLLAGDRVVLMFQDAQNQMTGVAFRVKGFYQSPVDSFDKYVVYVGLNALQSLTSLENKISQLSLRVPSRNHVLPIAKSLKNKIHNSKIEILTWQNMAPNLVQAIALYDTMSYIFFAIIFVTVIFSIANTLIMAIMERFHEIGVMKSIGTRPAWISAMVLFEAVSMGFVGLAAGMGISQICISILSVSGIDLSIFMESIRVWGTGAIIYPSLKPMDIFACAAIVFATTVIAAVYPAIKAARIKPLEALHYV